MRVVVAVGPAPSLRLVEMGVAAVVGGGGGAELGIRRRVVSRIGALMLLVRERMRARARLELCLLHQILVVRLHQMPQRIARRRCLVVVVAFHKASQLLDVLDRVLQDVNLQKSQIYILGFLVLQLLLKTNTSVKMATLDIFLERAAVGT